MGRPADPQRDGAIATIRRLVGEHGVKSGTRLAREQYLSVPIATWSRWRQTAVGNVSEADAQTLAGLAAEVRTVIPSPEELRRTMADPVTATRRALEFWKMLDELELDVQLLREYALTKGSDGQIKVRVPFALRDAHRMRCDLIRLSLQQAEAAYGADRAARFFDGVIAQVAKESPETARRIVGRLREFQSEGELRGF